MILLFSVAGMTLLGASGAYFFKKASSEAGGLSALLRMPQLYMGLCLYGISAILNVILLRYMDYSILYPMTALTYIWTLLISWKFLKESIGPMKLAGVFLIVGGVYVLSQSV